jgi:hypothetical protein
VLDDINAGGPTTIADPTTIDFGAFLPPGCAFVPGADYGRGRSAAGATRFVEKTLTAGLNTLSASIYAHPSVYPEPMDFFVPVGFVAQDFRVEAVAGGTSTSGYSCQPGLGI